MLQRCPFCLDNGLLRGEVLYKDELWYYVQGDDGELKGGGMAITMRHIATPFELHQDEWLALHALLPTFRSLVDQYSPDGYNIGWNVGEAGGQNVMHAHLHFVPRYADEPLAGKGMRYAFKQTGNRRR